MFVFDGFWCIIYMLVDVGVCDFVWVDFKFFRIIEILLVISFMVLIIKFEG